MKKFRTSQSMIALAVIALVGGCGKSDQAPPSAPPPPATSTAPSPSSPVYASLADASPAALRSLFGVQLVRVANEAKQDASRQDASKQAAAEQGAAKQVTVSRADKNFLKDAVIDGLYEIEVAKVASEKATDPAVKALADQLISEHTAANNELQQLASSRNIEIPTELPMSKRRAIDKLRQTSSDNFDRQFINKVVIKDHEKDIKRFEKAARSAKDPDIRAWAEKNLPTLRQHLAHAQSLPGATGKTAGTTSRSAPGVSGRAGSSASGAMGSGDTGDAPRSGGATDTEPEPGSTRGMSGGSSGSETRGGGAGGK